MTHRYLDPTSAGDVFARPGADTRQWVSIATVDADTPDQRSVQFTTEYGPLVSVTLRPSATPCVCRVAHEVAGNGEGEWFPFLAGDEVVVMIPEGDENAGCVILGRLNQEIDAFPSLVAGQDPSTNTFAFRRLRTPYVLETAASYLVRSAVSGAFFSLTADGSLTFGTGDSGIFAMSSSLLGLQDPSGTVLLQIDVEAKQVVLEAVGTKLVLDAALSYLYTNGALQIGTSGNPAAEHVLTTEGFFSLLVAVAAALTTMTPLPVTTSANVGAALTAMLSGAGAPQLALALLAAAAGKPLPPPLSTAIAAAIAASSPKPPAAPGVGKAAPGIGCVGLLAG